METVSPCVLGFAASAAAKQATSSNALALVGQARVPHDADGGDAVGVRWASTARRTHSITTAGNQLVPDLPEHTRTLPGALESWNDGTWGPLGLRRYKTQR